MLDALAKAGLATKSDLTDLTAQDRQRRALMVKQFTGRDRDVNATELDTAGNVSEFRDSARRLLTSHPELIDQVVEKAHRFKDADGGDRLVWTVYQVRDILRQLKGDQREQFLRRAFRRSGATLEIK
jgi:hypothetical protein